MNELIERFRSFNDVKFPRSVEQLKAFKDLDLSNLRLEDFLPALLECDLPNLKGINLDGTNIHCLPDNFARLHIKRLGLSNNPDLDNIKVIERLTNLECLILNKSYYTSLPNFPPSLKELHMYKCRCHINNDDITQIISAINLEVLNLAKNEFQAGAIDRLQNLTHLKQIILDDEIAIPNWLQDWERCEKVESYYDRVSIFTRRGR